MTSSTFSAALKTLRVDERGRINIGTVFPAAKNGAYQASVNADGHILLTPVADEVDG